MDLVECSQEVAELFEDLVRALVDEPETASVRALVGMQSTVLEVMVEQRDFSKVVGKKGRTANALRELATCISGALGTKIRLELVAPEDVNPAVVAASWHPVRALSTEHLLARVVQAMVDQPDQVQVTTLEGEHTQVFELSVASPDVRRVIGRHGNTASSLRDLLTNLGSKAGRRYILEILEPPRPSSRPRPQPSEPTASRFS